MVNYLKSKLEKYSYLNILFLWPLALLISYIAIFLIRRFLYPDLSSSVFLLIEIIVFLGILNRQSIFLMKSFIQAFKKARPVRKAWFFLFLLFIAPPLGHRIKYALFGLSSIYLETPKFVEFLFGFVVFTFIIVLLYVLFIIILGKGAVSNSHGSAAWASESEIKNIFSEENTGVSIDGINRISEKNSFQNIGIVAPSGFGKTQTYVLPNIFFSGDQNRSIIVTDPSGEIFKRTSGYMDSKGYNIHLIEPFSDNTDFYNPLQNVKTLSDAKIVADSVLRQIESKGNPFWHTSAAKLLSGLIMLLKKSSDMESKNYMNFKNIKRVLSLSIDDMEKLIKADIFEDIKIELSSFLKSNESTRSGIEMTLDSALSLFSDEKYENVTSKNSIDFKKLREKKSIIYMSIPESKIKYSAPFLSVFYKQLFESLMSNSDGLPVYVFLDEFGNMGCIPDFSNIITTSRKKNISISMILQDIDQIKNIYGDKSFSTIFNGGCVSKIYYPGLGLETCKYISETLGDSTIEISSTSSHGDTTSETRRRLLNSDEVRKLCENEILFINSNYNPLRMETTPSYKNEIIKSELDDKEGHVFKLDEKELDITEKIAV